ncbi:MAG: hypothetical protein H6Q00_428 [Holophagaceae bacterium]|nr:hypothetical protein [Holophagaceae bacterium]
MAGSDSRKHKKKWAAPGWSGSWDNWESIPPVFQLALAWAFLRCGPSCEEDLLFLRGACSYGQLSHLAILMQEEPRWMRDALLRCWPLLAERRIVEGVAYFLSQRTPDTLYHQLDRREIQPQEPWRIAFHEITHGLDQGTEDALRYLRDPLPHFSDFIVWIYEILLAWIVQEIDAAILFRLTGSTMGFEVLSSLPASFHGRIIPLEMGEWHVEKKLFPSSLTGKGKLLRWVYQGYRLPIGAPYHPYELPLSTLTQQMHAGAGANPLFEPPYPFIGALREKSNHRESLRSPQQDIERHRSKDARGLADLRRLITEAVHQIRERIIHPMESPVLAAFTEDQLALIAAKVDRLRRNARMNILIMTPLRPGTRCRDRHLRSRRRTSLDHLRIDPIQRGWLWLYLHLRRSDPGLNWMAWLPKWRSIVPKNM